MAELRAKLGLDNGEFQTGLEQAHSKLQEFNESFYEGPKSEMRQRRQLGALVKDLANAKDLGAGFTSVIDRLSESFRILGAASIAVGIGVVLQEQMLKAAESATKFFDAFQKGFGLTPSNASRKEIEETVKEMDEADQKYGDRGWLEKIIYGRAEDRMIEDLRDRREELKSFLDDLEAQGIQAETKTKSTDIAERREGELAKARLEYEEKIADARAQFGDQAARAMRDQETAVLDEIGRKYDELAKKANDTDRRQIMDLLKTQGGPQYTEALKNEQAGLQRRVDQDEPGFIQGSTKHEDELALAQVTKEIAEGEARINDERARGDRMQEESMMRRLSNAGKIAYLTQKSAELGQAIAKSPEGLPRQQLVTQKIGVDDQIAETQATREQRINENKKRTQENEDKLLTRAEQIEKLRQEKAALDVNSPDEEVRTKAQADASDIDDKIHDLEKPQGGRGSNGTPNDLRAVGGGTRGIDYSALYGLNDPDSGFGPKVNVGDLMKTQDVATKPPGTSPTVNTDKLWQKSLGTPPGTPGGVSSAPADMKKQIDLQTKMVKNLDDMLEIMNNTSGGGGSALGTFGG